MTTAGNELWLVVEEGATAGAFVRLGDTPVLVGRDPAAELRMDPQLDRLASARHVRLDPSDEGWVVTDLGSRNGSFVNGLPLQDARLLRPGDRIQLGNGGPVLRLSDERPASAHSVPDARRTPSTREAFRPPRSQRRRLIAAGVGVATVAAVVAAWALGTDPSAPGDAAELLDGPAGTGADPDPVAATAAGSDDGAGTDAGTDTASARQAAEIAALRERIEGMDEELRAAQGESRRLRDELEDARRAGASSDRLGELERQLQDANASLRRQQLAASVDYEYIGRIAQPATALVYVEFEGGRVEAATAFGVDRAGLLVTNRHVVSRDENDGLAVLRIGVQYADRTEVMRARVGSISRSADLALLEIVDADGELPAITRFNASPDTLPSGAPVVLFGFPLGGSAEERGPARPLVSSGVLMGRRGGLLEIEGYARGGASGSPILDTEGHVIGVLVGGRTDEGGGERLYAVPAPDVVRFLESASGPG